jgi:hypothetical protein
MARRDVEDAFFSVVCTLVCLLAIATVAAGSAPNWANSVALERKLIALLLLGISLTLLLAQATRLAK